MTSHTDALVHQLLGAAWQSLNDAAADLSLLVPLARSEALAADARVLAEAVEREADALSTAAARWQERRS